MLPGCPRKYNFYGRSARERDPRIRSRAMSMLVLQSREKRSAQLRLHGRFPKLESLRLSWMLRRLCFPTTQSSAPLNATSTRARPRPNVRFSEFRRTEVDSGGPHLAGLGSSGLHESARASMIRPHWGNSQYELDAPDCDHSRCRCLIVAY